MHELERLYHIHCAKGEVGRYVILLSLIHI